MPDEDRYWILYPSSKDVDTSRSNRLKEVAAAVQRPDATKPFPIVGLVDEQDGGVIGYLHADYADDICLELNLANQ